MVDHAARRAMRSRRKPPRRPRLFTRKSPGPRGGFGALLDPLERRIGAKLFERAASGLSPTALCIALVESLDHMEEDALAVERRPAARALQCAAQAGDHRPHQRSATIQSLPPRSGHCSPHWLVPSGVSRRAQGRGRLIRALCLGRLPRSPWTTQLHQGLRRSPGRPLTAGYKQSRFASDGQP